MDSCRNALGDHANTFGGEVLHMSVGGVKYDEKSPLRFAVALIQRLSEIDYLDRKKRIPDATTRATDRMCTIDQSEHLWIIRRATHFDEYVESVCKYSILFAKTEYWINKRIS